MYKKQQQQKKMLSTEPGLGKVLKLSVINEGKSWFVF